MEMFCIGMLAGLIVTMIVFVGGVIYGNRVDNNNIVYNPMGDNNDSADLPESDRSSMEMDGEVAQIALRCIKHDLHNLLSDVEKRALVYAVECIDIRVKVELWLDKVEGGMNE